jgi:hypothetical protein
MSKKYTVVQLKKVCKERRIKGCNKMKKAELMKIISTYTIPELKKICKEKGIKGYSKMKKDELIKQCLITENQLNKSSQKEKTKKLKKDKIKKTTIKKTSADLTKRIIKTYIKNHKNLPIKDIIKYFNDNYTLTKIYLYK